MASSSYQEEEGWIISQKRGGGSLGLRSVVIQKGEPKGITMPSMQWTVPARHSICIFSTSSRHCCTALLYNGEHVFPLDLPKLDLNFCSVPGPANEFFIHQERCCYVNHHRFETAAGETTELHNICGRDDNLYSMLKHKQREVDLVIGKETVDYINACPDEYHRPGCVTRMGFQKVA